MNAPVAEIARFYDLLDRLAVRVGGLRVLADCTGGTKWPQRGVYFFYEDGETLCSAINPSGRLSLVFVG